MKFYKRCAAITVAVCTAAASVAALAGCGKINYKVYTNVPATEFEMVDNNYKIERVIDGFAGDAADYSKPTGTENYTARRFVLYAMTTDVDLVVCDDFTAEGAEEKYTAFKTEVQTLLNGIDKAISTTVDSSDITAFNNADAGETITVSQTAFEVLETALQAYEFTEGYYNPALYYNIYAYGFGGSKTRPQTAADLPDDETIAKYTSLASRFGEVKLSAQTDNAEENKFYVQKPDCTVDVNGKTLSMKIDLGGIGKGYATDKVNALFDKYGYKYGYFNFGTSSMAVKEHYLQGNFTIGAYKPRQTSDLNDYYMTTPARNTVLSTSGDDVQRYVIDGVRYCHIIDPTTGKPIQTGIMSVMIIGGNAAQDDAYTTALMCMGADKAQAFISQKLNDRRVIFTCS